MHATGAFELDGVNVAVNNTEFALSGANYVVNRGVDEASAAIAAGRITQEEVDKIAIHSASAARGDEVGVDFAINAGISALKSAGLTPDRIGVCAHSWAYDQGHELWSPSHYVAHQIGLVNATPINVYYLSNGAGLSVDSVHGWLATHNQDHGLVTTGDRFDLPRFDRWNSSDGVAYGDGGTAVVVSRAPTDGTLRVAAIGHASAPQLEKMHRGNDPLGPHRCSCAPVDMGRLKDEFLSDSPKGLFSTTRKRYVRAVVTAVLHACAGVDVDEVYLPRIGKPAFDQYDRAVSEVVGVSARFLADTTGHIGSGDLIANLADFEQRSTGRTALFLSAGSGFTWTAMLVQRIAS